jgi:hypothetical protein
MVKPAEVEEKEGHVFVSAPYCGPLFHRLRQEARKVGVRLVSKSSVTIGSKLVSRIKFRPPEEQRSNVVYSVKCSCGARYVGETSQELQSRIKEHRRSFQLNDGKSALSSHQGHDPDWEGVQVLAQESHHRRRLLKESAFIRTYGKRVIVET